MLRVECQFDGHRAKDHGQRPRGTPIVPNWTHIGPYWLLLVPVCLYWTPLAPSGSYLVLLDLLLVPIGPYIVRGELVHVRGGQCENQFVPKS